MKALHVVQRYHPTSPTGSELAMTILCEALAWQKDHAIIVATSQVDPGEGFYNPFIKRFPVGDQRIKAVKVIRLPVAWWKSSLFYVIRNLLPWLNNLTGGWLGVQAFGPHLLNLESVIDIEKPDLIHASPMPMNHTYQAWQLAQKYRLPLVITPTMHFDDPLFDNALIYRMLAGAQAVIAHTDYEKKQLIAHQIDPAKIAVIPSSYLTAKAFATKSSKTIRNKYRLADRPIALFIGSKSYNKGTVTLLKTWPLVRQQLPQAVAIIAGLPTKSWGQGKVDLDMIGVIELDYVSDKLKNDLLDACNVLCVPSRSESFGMILLEAWAKGKPVIGGSAGATRELVEEGINGYTVEFGNEKQLVKTLVRVLRDASLQRRLGQAGLQKSKQFTKKAIVSKTLAVYKEVLAAPSSALITKTASWGRRAV